MFNLSNKSENKPHFGSKSGSQSGGAQGLESP